MKSQLLLCVVELKGHLTPASLQRALQAIEAWSASDDSADLLVDCQQMTSYEESARNAFVSFIAGHRRRLGRVAIVTEKKLWHMAIASMGFAAGFPLRAFSKRHEAEFWLGGVGTDTREKRS